jgi:hypothetical protein
MHANDYANRTLTDLTNQSMDLVIPSRLLPGPLL